jgi:peptidyl-tRNA hydrolase, PTH1 family
MKFLIAGLGNPGKAYAGTRHNIGFEAVAALAAKHGLEFQKRLKWKGSVAQGKAGGADIVLLMPLTFMNESGAAVFAVMRYMDVDPSRLLVIVDDIAIPMTQIRMRGEGSSGGHNGLKSVEEHLQTNQFARLRIGVGDREQGDLASHVLGRFSKEEKQLIPEILERAVKAIEIWLEKGLNHAMDFANRKTESIKPKLENE